MSTVNSCKDFYSMPDARGHVGIYGGKFVAETLMQPLEELRLAYERYRNDPQFIAELEHDLKHFVGRPLIEKIDKTVIHPQVDGYGSHQPEGCGMTWPSVYAPP